MGGDPSHCIVPTKVFLLFGLSVRHCGGDQLPHLFYYADYGLKQFHIPSESLFLFSDYFYPSAEMAIRTSTLYSGVFRTRIVV